MRTRLSALALAGALVGAGCGPSLTEPYRTVTAPPPSGLAVAETSAPTPTNVRPLAATVAASGDSVVVTYVYDRGPCGLEFSASAGIVDGALVVTHVSRFSDQLILCTADAPRVGPTFRLAVVPARRGRLAVVLRQRLQQRSGSAEFHEREIVRGTVTLP